MLERSSFFFLLSLPLRSGHSAGERTSLSSVEPASLKIEFVKLKVVLPKGPDPALEAFVSEWDRKGFNPRDDGAS